MRTLVALVFAASTAQAQWIAPVDPSEEDLAEADRALTAGHAALDREHWSEALDALEHSYALGGSPDALLGIGQALIRLGQRTRAERALDRVLRTTTDEALRQQAEALRVRPPEASPLDAIPWIVAATVAIVILGVIIGAAIWEADSLQPMSSAVLRL